MSSASFSSSGPAAHTPFRCPKCAGEMATYERSGITVDQCRECRGIFLDRGELERLVDAEGGAWLGPAETRAPGTSVAAGRRSPAPYRPEWGDQDDDHRRRPDDRPRHEGDRYPDARYPDARYGDPRYADPRYGGGKPYKKRSFLGELLEGFGD